MLYIYEFVEFVAWNHILICHNLLFNSFIHKMKANSSKQKIKSYYFGFDDLILLLCINASWTRENWNILKIKSKVKGEFTKGKKTLSFENRKNFIFLIITR
jgi:hypothetical protein